MSKKLIGISIGGYQAKYGDMRALEIAKEIGADAVLVGEALMCAADRKAVLTEWRSGI